MRYSRLKSSLLSGIFLCLLSVLPAHAQEQVIFDSLFRPGGTTLNTIGFANDTPRTFMGQAYDAINPFGPTFTGGIEVTRIQFVLINVNRTSYQDVRANLAFFINSTGQTGGANDVMAGLLGGGVQTFSIGAQNNDFLINKVFDTPIQLRTNVDKLLQLGLTISFEGRLDALSAYATTDNLTAAISFGTPTVSPVSVGANAIGIDRDGFYRNESGKTDYNFLGTDADGTPVGQEKTALAFRLFGQQIAAVPEPSSVSLFGLAAVTGGVFVRRRRNRSAS